MHIGRAQVASATARSAPPQDRRLPPDQDARARLRWLRGLVRRPFKLLWRSGLPRLVWVERRRAPANDLALLQLRTDLRAELLALGDDALALQELMRVAENLERTGWAGVIALPTQSLARAAMQAEMLAAATASSALADLARRLRAVRPSPAQAPAAKAPGAAMADFPGVAAADSIEVLELGEDAYAQAEQQWADSQTGSPSVPPKDSDLKA